MTEFNQVFDGDLAERVFIIGSILFAALFAAGIFLQRPVVTGARRMAFYGKTAMTALLVAAAVSTTMGGFGVFGGQSNATPNSPASISIGDLHKSIDVRSLPVQFVENPI
jgi:hypothetical protein